MLEWLKGILQCPKRLSECQELVEFYKSNAEKDKIKAEALNDECTKKVEIIAGFELMLKEATKPVDVPSANVTYRRPVIIAKNELIQVETDVRNFIMPDFEIKDSLKKKGLVYDGTQDLDALIPKIYRHAKANYKYGPDADYGLSEYVMFPFELRAMLERKKGGDCDDWSNMIGSHFVAAGIPRDKWLVSYGIARAGFGHATIYAKDNNGTWRHLNSTRPESNARELPGFPSNKDNKDSAGIKEDGFWFSYNDLFSVHDWESEEAKASFKAAKIPVDIRRNPL